MRRTTADLEQLTPAQSWLGRMIDTATVELEAADDDADRAAWGRLLGVLVEGIEDEPEPRP